jgi:hypothetical protein
LNAAGFKVNPTVTTEKLTQDLVAGNPKSVIRQKMGAKRRVGLFHLQRATATLTPNIHRMRISGLFKKIEDHHYCIRIKTI